MKESILKLVAVYAYFLSVFILLKPLFLLFYPSGAGLTDVFEIIGHGFSMDLSIAAYLTVIPALLIISAQWCGGSRWLAITWIVYQVFASGVIAMITVIDLVLYGYWGFRLDVTPFFYFMTSPSSAMASAEWWQIPLGLIAVTVLWSLLYFAMKHTVGRIHLRRGGGWKRVTVMALLTCALFLPLRGGVTVSTMNPSRAYYSQNQRFNHAATNPVFNLMYSALHQDKWDEQYRFMSADEADEAIAALDSAAREEVDSAAMTMLTVERPDVVLIILESFSSHLLPSLGGEAVAVRLDSIARSGWLFDNFYACSFRTDRALPSIMSGFPGLPSTSLMKNVDKIEKAPSFPREMKRHGWELSYFYGGDANFTNMLAYLVSQGFENIISDKDFPASQRRSKWGAHDDVVFGKALNAIREGAALSLPRLDVIQTSSSHEPFEVPYSNHRFADSPRKNAFAFTDSCLGAFVDSLRGLPRWDRTLVMIVPDHYGVYPQNLDNPLDRHRIPLVLTGGALASAPQRVSVTGSQNDIAATLLGALEINADTFPFSKNMLDPSVCHYAFFTEPSVTGLVIASDFTVFNCDSDAPIASSPDVSPATEKAARAILQKLYDNLSEL